MLKSLLLLPVLFVAFTASACSQNYKNVDVSEAKKMIEKQKVVLVDVRTDGEWNAGHLKDAKHIDISKPDFDKKISELKKDATVIVYCAVGGRSSRAAGMMSSKGFKKVYNMDGGINAWAANDFPIVK